MKQEKFTEQAQEALARSQELVRRYRHSQWDVEHVLLAMLHQQGGLAGEVLRELGVDKDSLAQQVEAALDISPKMSSESTQVYATPRVSKVLEAARDEADRLKDEYIGVEHLLLAIAAERGGQSAQILRKAGVDQEKVYAALARIRGSQRITPPRPESK